MIISALTTPATPLFQAHFGGFLFLYSLPMKYTDAALTIEEQLELLRSYKLAINDEDQVKHFLKVIGYFRLNNYMKHFKDGKQFIANTSIEDIVYS